MQWDPTQYLRYGDERLRPALDLMARVPLQAPGQVVDLGCGPGNVTRILKQRWAEAVVTGVDSSPEMLAKARETVPECRFVQGSFGDWVPQSPPELIYSNAALHWLGGHETLFPRLISLLPKGGVLAVQMPGMHAAPLRALQHEIAASGPWAAALAEVGSAPPILETGAYWDLLRPRCSALDMWETTYMHALQGENAAVQWATGTSLKPFLDRLTPELRAKYLEAYSAAVAPVYPRRADGTTLLPFRRVFMVAVV